MSRPSGQSNPERQRRLLYLVALSGESSHRQSAVKALIDALPKGRFRYDLNPEYSPGRKADFKVDLRSGPGTSRVGFALKPCDRHILAQAVQQLQPPPPVVN